MQCQGLSLSLRTLMPSTAFVSPFQYQYHDTGLLPLNLMTDFPNLKETMSLKDDEANMASVSSGGFHDIIKKEGIYNMHPSMCLKELPSDPCMQGSPGFSNSILNSQYLKAAKEMPDEIVSIRKALKQAGMEKQENFRDIGLDGSKDHDGKSTSGNGSTANASCELSPGKRQNLLGKKTKLLSMLDEVANWFINARVRLWKPMIEEMYKEEFGDSEMNCNLSSDNTIKGNKRDDVQESDNNNNNNNNKWEESSKNNLVTVENVQVQPHEHAEMDRGVQVENVVMDRGDQNQRLSMNNNNNNNNRNLNCGDGNLLSSTHAIYDLSELGNFTVKGQVSLALEMRNCESDGFAMSDDVIHKPQTTLVSSPETDLLDYHFTDSGKQQYRFGNPHLMHEFVA